MDSTDKRSPPKVKNYYKKSITLNEHSNYDLTGFPVLFKMGSDQ